MLRYPYISLFAKNKDEIIKLYDGIKNIKFLNYNSLRNEGYTYRNLDLKFILLHESGKNEHNSVLIVQN